MRPVSRLDGLLRGVLLTGAFALCGLEAARAFPATADVFAPPSLEETSRGGTISDGLRSAGPGEIVTLAGDFPEAAAGFEVFGQTTAGDAYRASIKPLRLDARTAVLLLPEALPARSTYLVWPKNSAGFGKAFAVNRTEAWWIGPRRFVAGAPFSVFGRNLTLGPGRASVFVATPDGDRRLRVLAANPYRLDVEAPDLPDGAYDLWTHNGGGGPLGWSGPLRFELNRETRPERPRIFDVRSFGAAGDGRQDDGPAIEAALAAASLAAPSTVYFPPGVYPSRRSFEAPSNVAWRGAGHRESVLKLAVPLDLLGKSGFIHAAGQTSGVSFERLSIEADRQVKGTDQAVIAFSGSRLRFSEFSLSSWSGMTLRLSADDVVLEDGEIIGAGSFLASSSQLSVSRVTFRMTSDGEAALTSWGGSDIAITNSLLVNADPDRRDGFGIGRLFVAQPHFGSVRNVYFSENETRNSAPRDCAAVDCNKGEQILFEFGSVTLRGAPDAIGPASVTFRGLELGPAPRGLDVVIAGGPGLGQRRRIVAAADGLLRLDRPWDVMPDVSRSRFFVTAVAERVVVYRNSFEGRETHSQHDSNSTAVLAWGLCYDFVIADNDVSRMRHGVMVAATSGTPQDSVSAPFFTLVENNRITNGYDGVYTGLTFGYDTASDVSGGVGNVFRKNDIQSMSRIGIAFDTWDSAGGAFSATAFERNLIRDVRYGVASGLKLIWSGGSLRATPVAGTRLRQTVLHGNDVETSAAAGGVAFRSDAFQDWLDIGNEWSGPEAKGGASPDLRER